MDFKAGASVLSDFFSQRRIIELTDAADKSLEKEKFELSQLRETKSNLQNKVEELNSTAAVIEKQNIQVNAELEEAVRVERNCSAANYSLAYST